MKYSAKIEIDGTTVVGYIPKLGGCYVQANRIQDISPLMKIAIKAYIDNYNSRMEPFFPEPEHPKINHKIQFFNLSSNQLGNILKQFTYTKELHTKYFHLYRKGIFPFDRILIPNTNIISPLIIKKIFGSNNVIVLKEEENQFSISGQA